MAADVVFVASTSIIFAAPCRSQGMLSRALFGLRLKASTSGLGVLGLFSPDASEEVLVAMSLFVLGHAARTESSQLSPLSTPRVCGLLC